MKRVLLCLLALCLMLTAFTGCGEKEKDSGTWPGELLAGKHYAEIVVANYGAIVVELDADVAPITVTNFVRLAEQKFYDGLTFHRVINGFMMQGGDPDGNGSGGSANNIKGEFTYNGVQNNISHKRGVISMARTNDPNSASSQFFIMHKDSPHLDGQYAAFGQVVSGIEVVDRVCTFTPVTDDNGTVLAKNQPKITSVRVLKDYTPTTGTTSDGLKDPETEGCLTGTHYVEIDVKDYGTIRLELYADTAPRTVTNFVKLVEEGFYDGVAFHRIIKDFMMQGGDPDGDGSGGSSETIVGEFSANGYRNSLSHTRGVISMARTNDPNSASSQFFIVHKDSQHLDGNYAAFGQVIAGMDVVDAVCENTPVQDGNGSVAVADRPVMTAARVITME